MSNNLKKAINLIRLIPTVITCAVLVFYAGYLGINIKNGIGNTNANIVFLIITAISFALRILLYLRVVSGNTSRRVNRLCRVARLLTNIFSLGVAIYTSSVASSFISFLMLPVWLAQLTVEIIAAVIERIGSNAVKSVLGRKK